ncbi:Uncharacterized conserved protein, contains Mth938-like domain [Kordiimonas lacus]|uniref:Uncharacterized conserved protein, contains Mth938-like domain n=2 Tax=Kordiimonadaceae TaxID=1331809 RepID=A0A1G6VTF7_9PROT|nr:Uncharacterized conserved protein, contains Mth938-like domain [Kordiimonas lacus]
MEQQADDDLLLIEAYGDGGFRLMDRRVEGGVLVQPTGFYPMDAKTLDDLKPEHFSKIMNEGDRPEIVLVGTGVKMQLLPKAIRQFLEDANIGFDIMDTGAAARTYNVLLMEQRRVACLLLPVD